MISTHWRYPVERAIFDALAFCVLRAPGRLHVEGAEHLSASGPFMVVGNHIATLDPPMIGSLVRRYDVHYMAKAEVFRTRWARFFLAGWNTFPVVRHSADRHAMDLALRVLAEGHVLVLFPEGSRSPDGTLQRAYPGAGFIARRSGVPVIPAAIWGSEDVLPKGALIPRSAHVHVRFGRPLHVPARTADGRRTDNQEAVDLIMAHLAELLPERYRGAYAEPAAAAVRPATPPSAA